LYPNNQYGDGYRAIYEEMMDKEQMEKKEKKKKKKEEKEKKKKEKEEKMGAKGGDKK